MIDNERYCLKNVGHLQLVDATSHCHSLNASQILPRSKRESDDLVPALLSLGLISENGKTLVSVGIQNTTEEGGWHDSSGQLISYFNWLPNEPDNDGGNQSYAGFQINGVDGNIGWADFRSVYVMNVVCAKKGQSQGESIKVDYFTIL